MFRPGLAALGVCALTFSLVLPDAQLPFRPDELESQASSPMYFLPMKRSVIFHVLKSGRGDSGSSLAWETQEAERGGAPAGRSSLPLRPE